MNSFYYFCMENRMSVDLRNYSIQCQYKKELYVIFQSDCEIYVPPVEFANAVYWRRIVA